MNEVNGIKIKTVKKEWDVYFDMALTMLDVIIKNNEQGKNTVMIVPVGPTDQYPILARLVNQLRVSLKNVYFFNMDDDRKMLKNSTYDIKKTNNFAIAKLFVDSQINVWYYVNKKILF